MGSKWGPNGVQWVSMPIWIHTDPFPAQTDPWRPKTTHISFLGGSIFDRFRTFSTGPADFSENVPKIGPGFFRDRISVLKTPAASSRRNIKRSHGGPF